MTDTRTPDRAEFLSDVITTAVQGGINYWASVSGYRWFSPTLSGGTAEHPDGLANAYVYVHEDGGANGVFVGLDKIEAAIAVIRSKPIEYVGNYRRRLIIENDDTNGNPEQYDYIDADSADIIMQIAVLGEVVYG